MEEMELEQYRKRLIRLLGAEAIMKFNYYGHSAFTLSDDVTTILFDPFIPIILGQTSVPLILPVNTSSSPTVTATTTAMLKPLPKRTLRRLSARQKSQTRRLMQAVRLMLRPPA